MSRTIYYAMGPESSGTKLFRDILVKCGCEDASIEPVDGADKVVIHRSLPYGGCWADIAQQAQAFHSLRYNVICYFMVRDYWATIQSQLKNNHVSDETAATRNIKSAYCYFQYCANLTVIPVTFELLSSSAYLEKILQCGGLKLDKPAPKIYDANAKYYRK